MTAEAFNKRFNVGTQMKYYPIKFSPEFEIVQTRSEAWALGSGQAVVKVEGRAGGVSVDHLEPISYRR